MTYKLGSLFDCSGGFPLAGSLCGIEPCWAAEVEPYPIAVTKSRFPRMKHLGSVTDIKGGEIEPVDIITFGSPCQDLSVAGKRAGLKHEANGDEETTRSGLFMEAVRIIKEMRKATDGKYPTFALWENVPGAFSSNKGEDFRTVCEELIQIVEPGAVMPAVPQNGWPYADCYCGDGWSLAYRTFDAQYWGVPQRRRRIYLVLDLRGQRAGKVLFERPGLRGYFAEGGTPWQGSAADAERGAGAADRNGGCVGRADVSVLPFDTTQVTSPQNYSNPKWGDPCHPLAAQGHPPAAVVCMASQQGGAEIMEDKCPTITAAAGMSGNNQPVACYPVQGNGVAFAMQGFGDYIESNVGSGLKARDYKDATDLVVFDKEVCGVDCRNMNEYPELYPTLQAKPNGGQSLNFSGAVRVRYIVRRLTPTECARLQGFPDKWGHPDKKEDFTEEEYRFWLEVRNTHAAINDKAVKEYTKEQMLTWYNKLHTDSSEYKMWGNGIALPTALYCLQGMADALREE